MPWAIAQGTPKSRPRTNSLRITKRPAGPGFRAARAKCRARRYAPAQPLAPDPAGLTVAHGDVYGDCFRDKGRWRRRGLPGWAAYSFPARLCGWFRHASERLTPRPPAWGHE
jgi:hypothetical protein